MALSGSKAMLAGAPARPDQMVADLGVDDLLPAGGEVRRTILNVLAKHSQLARA